MSEIVEFVGSRFPYWATAALLVIGLYGMIGKRSLIKKVVGLNILQSAIILFFIAGSLREGGGVPILYKVKQGAEQQNIPEAFVNPLPHVLMLTAIVVGVAITGAALAFLVRIRQEFGTLDENALLEEVRE